MDIFWTHYGSSIALEDTHIFSYSSQQSKEVGIIILSILKLKKRRHSEVY